MQKLNFLKSWNIWSFKHLKVCKTWKMQIEFLTLKNIEKLKEAQKIQQSFFFDISLNFKFNKNFFLRKAFSFAFIYSKIKWAPSNYVSKAQKLERPKSLKHFKVISISLRSSLEFFLLQCFPFKPWQFNPRNPLTTKYLPKNGYKNWRNESK